MSNKYNKKYYATLSEKTGFQRDVIEKVHRLTTILEYINDNPKLSNFLALKGGTAINLTVFNLPRLSVDIDLDFCAEMDREEMLLKREELNGILIKYFEIEGYRILPKSKNPHSLDSWVIGYINSAGNQDIIKVEINYSLRVHIFPIKKRKILTEIFEKEKEIYCLDILDIFGSKIAALLNRTAARDLYDLYNLIYFGIIDEEEYNYLRKCVIFYKIVSGENLDDLLDVSIIDKLTKQKINQDLIPMLKKRELFNLEIAKEKVKGFLSSLLALTEKEKIFVENFKKGKYDPSLLFDDEEIINRIINHPMILWKIKMYNEKH